jgi:hypothetical protein
MADDNNPGQFGNRDDTQAQASAGGKASTGKFGSENGADPSKAGEAGNKAQPHAAKVEGGKNSHKNDSND